jgi:NADPH2:quinone reductase
VQSGDYVLIHAAAGGMGHILCPWVPHLGAPVIGTVSTDAKAEIARNLGCHHVINYLSEDFVAATRKITDGKGVHVVYESIGKVARLPAAARYVRSLRQASGVPDPINLIEDLGRMRPVSVDVQNSGSRTRKPAPFFPSRSAAVAKSDIGGAFSLLRGATYQTPGVDAGGILDHS